MQITATKRTEKGKKTKQLRAQRKLPAVVFGKDIESIPVTIDTTEFVRVYRQAGETNLVDVDVEGKKHKVLIKEIQYHPVSDEPLHANFHEVDLKQTINAEIPVEIIGAEENDLVKSDQAIPLTILNTITISALPTDLPDAFKVDISGLQEIGDSVLISDLTFNKDKVELVGYEEDDVIVKLDYAEMQEVEEEEEVDEQALIEGMEATQETAADADEGGEEKASAEPQA